MGAEREQAVKVTKEIIIKFIESGKLSLAGFENAWKQVYETVLASLKGPSKSP